MSINKLIKYLSEANYIAKNREAYLEDLLIKTISNKEKFDYIILDGGILVLTEFCFYQFSIDDEKLSSTSVALKSFRYIYRHRKYNSVDIDVDIVFSDYISKISYLCSSTTISKFLKKLEQKALELN
jgi:hypothetical protein